MGKKLLFVGDLFYDYNYIAEDIYKISEWIKKNDYFVVANMEGCIESSEGKPIKKRGPNLASSKEILKVLNLLNIKGVCLANNHIMDFGEGALKNTIECLDSNRILHCGAGKNSSIALEPMRFEMEDTSVTVLNFGWDVEETVCANEAQPGCAPRNKEQILCSIDEKRGDTDYLIVCLHWGFEYNRLPMPYDIDLAHTIIDAGADLVIGHHPHCVQPKESYRRKLIYYSLGNFYFAGRRTRYTKKFNEEIFNQSDYGCLVGYDLESGNITEHLIYYDHEKNSSEIIECEDRILKDISGIDWDSKQYVESAKRSKLNINPILTCDIDDNNRKIKKLYAQYKVKSFAKTILHK